MSINNKLPLIGVTAVGVVANLAVYFATQVLFPEGISLAGLDIFALVLAVVSFVELQRYKVPIYLMVPVGAVLGWHGPCCKSSLIP
jgi:chromate transporter